MKSTFTLALHMTFALTRLYYLLALLWIKHRESCGSIWVKKLSVNNTNICYVGENMLTERQIKSDFFLWESLFILPLRREAQSFVFGLTNQFVTYHSCPDIITPLPSSRSLSHDIILVLSEKSLLLKVVGYVSIQQ